MIVIGALWSCLEFDSIFTAPNETEHSTEERNKYKFGIT